MSGTAGSIDLLGAGWPWAVGWAAMIYSCLRMN